MEKIFEFIQQKENVEEIKSFNPSKPEHKLIKQENIK